MVLLIMVHNPIYGCCVPTPTQRAIPSGSVNEYQQKLGVNRHATRCTGPVVSVVLRLRLVSGWGLRKRRSVPWALEAWKRTLLYYHYGVSIARVHSFMWQNTY